MPEKFEKDKLGKNMKKTTLLFLILIGLFLSTNYVSAVYYMQGNFDSYGHYISSEMVSSPGEIPPMGGSIIIVRPQKDEITERTKDFYDSLSAQGNFNVNSSSLMSVNRGIYSSCVYPVAISGHSEESQCSTMRALYFSSGMLGTPSVTAELQKCIDDVNQYNSDMHKYNQCISDATQAAKDNINRNIDNATKQYNADILMKLNQFCLDTYGYSIWDDIDKTCKCASNLAWMIGGKCQLGLAVCAEMLGGNVIASTTGEMGCTCMEGYSVQKTSDNKYRCEKNELPAVPTATVESPIVAPIIPNSTSASVIKKQVIAKENSVIIDTETKKVEPTIRAQITNKNVNSQTRADQNQPVKKPIFKNISDSVSSFISKLFWFLNK